MAVARKHDSKAPSQNPNDFFVGAQQGGCYGKPTAVPEKHTENPKGLREPIYGRDTLGRGGDHTETDSKRQPSSTNPSGGGSGKRASTKNSTK